MLTKKRVAKLDLGGRETMIQQRFKMAPQGCAKPVTLLGIASLDRVRI